MKSFYLFLFTLLTVTGIQAQTPKEKIEQYRIAFITKELNLTVEEARLFWPVYDKYRADLETLRTNNKQDLDNIDYSKLTEDEAEKKAKEMFAFKQAELDLQKKYYAEFRKVLPAVKVLRLVKAEADFRQKLVELLQKRQGQK
ncbi:MAG: hypothetical protein ABL927_12340 [Bdellovibrionales bacterium]